MRLERVELPGGEGAEERAWQVVAAAYAALEPAPRRRSRLAVAVALGAALLVAAAASPAGRALLGGVREAVGVESAAPALVSLPADGRLLVRSPGAGAWVVSRDGSRRALGDWDEVRWSPRGLFVVGARGDTLAALEPDGGERWSLARPVVRSPRWAPSGFRIAYVSGRWDLRVVAGDGTGDRLLARGVTGPLAWNPAREHVLAYVQRGVLVQRHVDTGRVLSRRRVGALLELAWSSDGERLALVSPAGVRVLDAHGTVVRRVPGRIAGVAFAPRTHLLALARRTAPQSELLLTAAEAGASTRRLFSGPGAFGEVAWAPGGQWLLLDYPAADQWVFVSRDGRRVRGIGNLREHFRRGAAPLRLGGWCCVSGS